MEGLIVCPLLKKDDPLFQQEKDLLCQSARLFDIQLHFCSTFDCEAILLSRHAYLGFVYFYEEDLGLEDLAVRLGVFAYSNPKNYVLGHDLGAFYRALNLKGIPVPMTYACPAMKGVSLGDCFELLSLRMKEAGVNYPLNLRRRGEANCYKADLCLTPMEFNASLSRYGNEGFLAEEFIDGPLMIALVLGKKCVGVLENKGQEYVKSPLDNRFVRHEAESSAKALGRECALILFKRHGNIPLCIGVSSDLHLALFDCVYRSFLGERFFTQLLKAKKRNKHFVYISSEEIRAEKKALED